MGVLAEGVVISLPEVARATGLLRSAWTSVDVQAGSLRHRSSRFRGAWSTAAVLLHASTDLLAYCDSFERPDGERFSLRFANAGDDALSQLKAARPPYAAIRDWPSDLSPPPEFLSKGPSGAEVGLGTAISVGSTFSVRNVVPILWCCFSSIDGSLLLYADGEIPLNVGIVTDTGSIKAIKSELKAEITRQL